MAKLIGTDPNQVPTNGDLGTMAYQDYDVVAPQLLAGRRNLIINGAMQVWQRGDNTTGGGYFADRWTAISGLTSLQENSSGSPTGFSRNALIRRNVTGAAVIAQRIEATNCYQLEGNQVTVQFHHTTASGTCDDIDVELRYADASDDFSSTTQIQTTNITDTTTGYKTFTFNALPSDVTKGVELRITYNVTGDTSVRLTAVQLEVGSVATPFEHRSYGEELALCERYFQTSKVDNNVGIMVGEAGIVSPSNGIYANRVSYSFNTVMRTSPTVSYVGTMQIWDGDATQTVSSYNTTRTTPKYVDWDLVMTGALTTSMPCRLYANWASTTYFNFDAEL